MITGRDRVQLLLRAALWVAMQHHTGTVLEMINEALELARKGGDQRDIARALLRRGATLDSGGRHQEGDEDLRKAIEIAGEIGDKALLAEALSLRGTVLREMGRAEESLALHEAAVPLTRGLHRPRDTMRQVLAMANSLLDLGREEEALAIHKDCVEQARALGEAAFEALELGNVGSSLFALGRFAEAKPFQEQHLALARAVGYRRGEMFASANLGITARALGHLAEARTCHERTRLIAKALGDLMGEAIAFVQMGIDDLVLGELERGLSAVHSALTLSDEIRAQGITADAACTQGALLRLSNQIPEAEEALRKGLACYRAIRHPQGISAALLELGRLLVSTGRQAEAEAIFREVCEQSDRPAASSNLMARARLAALGKDDCALVIAATDEVESSLARSEAIEIRYCLWQSSGDVGQLRAAHRMLVDLEDHAPAASRQCLIDRIPIHREIRRACTGEHGAGPAQRSSVPGP
jgi:tetratricopeptide (TPR) repeat protein